MATTDPRRDTDYQEATGWTGWIAFAGIMMILLGILHGIAGFVGLFKEDYYLVGKSGLLVEVDYTTWGWVHLLWGMVVVLAGVGLLAGQMWARVVGVIFAMGSAIINVAFLSAYPIWSMIMIAVDVLVIWAITVHGREMKSLGS
jgi:hypothetical protein